MKIGILGFIVISFLTIFAFNANAGYGFTITSSSYSQGSNFETAVKSEFGSKYGVADWNDLKSYVDSGGDANTLKTFSNGMLTRNGQNEWNGRQYYAYWSTNPGQPPSSSFYVHDHIGQLYLGSWYNLKKPIVAKIAEIPILHGLRILLSGNPCNVKNGGILCIRFTQTGYAIEGWLNDPDHNVQSASISGPYGNAKLTYNLYSHKQGQWWTDPNISIVNPSFPQTWKATITCKNGKTNEIQSVLSTWEWAK